MTKDIGELNVIQIYKRKTWKGKNDKKYIKMKGRERHLSDSRLYISLKVNGIGATVLAESYIWLSFFIVICTLQQCLLSVAR